ncbi:hypothetical protein HDN1F_05960 [gamma proteobacterium HdN1]|nr:hypothetical protein HDN1F_05960 [gamma proteobacterium HdN1]
MLCRLKKTARSRAVAWEIALHRNIPSPMNETELNALKHAPVKTSQRRLAEALGVSIGKTNHILQGLIEKGYIKAERFINSNNKAAYRYVLTPSGIAERIRMTEVFVRRKKLEYEEMVRDLEALRGGGERE